jgi:hypothetical protein
MVIKSINEIKNPMQKQMKPIKEKQDIYIPDIDDKNISRRNGMIYVLTGSGGSGKSSLLLNMFKNTNMYRNKFHKIYYFCPMSSFLSVAKHPFEAHQDVYHELTVPILTTVYEELNGFKEKYEEDMEKWIKQSRGKAKDEVVYEESETDDEDTIKEKPEIKYSCVIIDDFADILKDKHIVMMLNKMLIKARHLCCGFIFTLQSYYYYPKILRKQLTYITIFKPKNIEEWNSIAKELLNMNSDDALTLFNYVFDEPYTHIDVDLVQNIYYKNFNKLLISS